MWRFRNALEVLNNCLDMHANMALFMSALRSFVPPGQLIYACKSCTEVKDNKELAKKDSHFILVSVDCREMTLIPYLNELHIIALCGNAVSCFVNFLLASSTICVSRVGKTCCRKHALTLGSYIFGVCTKHVKNPSSRTSTEDASAA
jgi:hypothetical protein